MKNQLARDLARALDPATIADMIGMDPDAWQEDVLRSRDRRILLNCCRQSGKSTTAATLAVHTAVYDAGSLTLLLAPAERQSKELFRKVLTTYRTLGRPVPPEAENALSLTLENASRIVTLPGQEATIRGFSGVRLLVVDEAARVPDDLYFAVRPMLAVSRGRLVAMSTPFGKRGWWYEAWRNGGCKWKRVEVPASDCPRIPEDFLDEEQRTMGEWFFRQEYLCEFLDAETQAFATDDIERMFSEEVQTWEL